MRGSTVIGIGECLIWYLATVSQLWRRHLHLHQRYLVTLTMLQPYYLRFSFLIFHISYSSSYLIFSLTMFYCINSADS